MIRCEDNGLTYYQFGRFKDLPQLAHGVFTRRGGVSPPPCQGLNLGFVPHDDSQNVVENLEMAANALNTNGLSFVGQVHGDNSLVIRASDEYQPKKPEQVKKGFDAMITHDPGVTLLTKLADCQGVMLFDPETNALAVVHSGWRGSVANIIGKTVQRLVAEFDVDPKRILAGISPSLGPCCSEFVNFRDELPESFWDYRKDNLFDFWAISRDQLVDQGVDASNVEISGICTKCSEEFFSYRREGVTGRFGLAAGVRE
jgi:YfiH family protein